MRNEEFVCSVSDLPPGTRRIVTFAGREIGLFNVEGSFFAIRNICPHQGAPLCRGDIVGTMLPSRPGEYNLGREGEIIRCPWHAWEFDLLTGASLFDERMRVRTFEVVVKDDRVYVVH